MHEASTRSGGTEQGELNGYLDPRTHAYVMKGLETTDLCLHDLQGGIWYGDHLRLKTCRKTGSY
jgi:hypothetical protein